MGGRRHGNFRTAYLFRYVFPVQDRPLRAVRILYVERNIFYERRHRVLGEAFYIFADRFQRARTIHGARVEI